MQSSVSPWGEAAATAVAYFVCASAALALTRFDGGVAVVWLAGAVLFAKLCATPRRRWSGLLLACIPAGVAASLLFGIRGIAGLALPTICIVEAYVAASLVKRAFPRFGGLKSVPEATIFLLIAGVAVPVSSGLLAAEFVHHARGISYWSAWRDWYAGHALGFIAFGPPLLLCLRGEARRWAESASHRRRMQAVGLLGLVFLASLVTFGQNQIPLVIVPFLPMIVATFRLGRFGAVFSIAILVIVGLSCSLLGHGPTTLLQASMAVKLQVLQIYFATIVLILLPLAAELKSRRRMIDRLHAAEALHRLVLDRMSDVVLRANVDGTVRYASPSAQQVTGYPPEELTGRALFNLIAPDDLPAVVEARSKALATPDEATIVEYRVNHKNGTSVWVESHFRAMVDVDGRVTGTVSIIREVTQRRQMVEDLTRQAMTDPLTGASNRRAFDGALSALLLSDPLEGVLGCLAVFDLDHFKRINDLHGHAMGDAVLVRFVELLRAAVREGDLVARLGGEEFAVLLTGLTTEQARVVCERIRIRFEGTVIRDAVGGIVPVTVSVGISAMLPGQQAIEVLGAADGAMYRAKQEGRNRSAAA